MTFEAMLAEDGLDVLVVSNDGISGGGRRQQEERECAAWKHWPN
jgi:hypothetical protein